MSYDVQTVKDELNGVFHGTTINKITNLAGLFNRAARKLLLDCNPIETKRIAQLGQVFNSVYDYSLPEDLKGVQVIDIRPQAGRWPSDQYEQSFARWFDAHARQGWNNAFNIQHNTGVKSLRLEAPSITAPITFTDTGSTTGWTAGGTASNLTVDTTFNVAGGGALQIDVTTGTGQVNNTTLSPFDFTDEKEIASLFFWVYMPSVATSVSLRWGSDLTANYYEGTTSITSDGNAFKAGWNLIKIPWAGLTATGSPTLTAYDSVRFSIVAPTNMVGVKFCNLTVNMGKYMEMVYYSKFLFSLAGVWKESITDTDSAGLTTIVNLDTESYVLFFDLLCYNITQQLQGADAQKDGQFFLQAYMQGLKRYTAMYKSEVSLPSEPWYEIGNRNVSIGPRWGV